MFEKFKEKCLEIYELDPAHFLYAPGLSWQTCLKNTGVKLELLTGEEEEYVKQDKNMLKQIINICLITIKIQNHHSYNI